MPPLKWVQHVSLVWSAGFVNLQEVWNKKLRKQLPDYSANKTPLRMFHVSQIRFGLQNKDLYFLCAGVGWGVGEQRQANHFDS